MRSDHKTRVREAVTLATRLYLGHHGLILLRAVLKVAGLTESLGVEAGGGEGVRLPVAIEQMVDAVLLKLEPLDFPEVTPWSDLST